MQAMTEGLLKSILKEGILRKDTPKQANQMMKRLLGEDGNFK